METITQRLRAEVRAAAEKHGSVNKLCQAAGVPQSSLAAWLAGSQANLAFSALDKLGVYLGLELRPAKRMGAKKAAEPQKRRKAGS